MSAMTVAILFGVLIFLLLVLGVVLSIGAFRKMSRDPEPYERGNPDPMQRKKE